MILINPIVSYFDPLTGRPTQRGLEYFRQFEDFMEAGMVVSPQKLISTYLDTNGDQTGTTDVVGNYATPTDFKITAQAGETLLITRMIVSIEDGAGAKAEEYGNLGTALTNGIDVVILDASDAIINTLTPEPVTTNARWGVLCYDVSLKDWGSSPTDELLVVRWTFERTGSPVKLPPGYSLAVRVNDDFTGLLSHHFLVQGTK